MRLRQCTVDRADHGVLSHRQLFRAAARRSRARVSCCARRRWRDYAEWAALREASRDFLTPWEPTWPADDLTRRVVPPPASSAMPRTSAAISPIRSSSSASRTTSLVGGLTLANIRRGCRPGRQPRLLDGRGLCAAGLHDRARCARVVPFAFGTLRLHRIEAACIPGQCRVDPAAGKDRLPARGLCPPISVHQRGLAGPPAVCASQGRS